MSESTERHCSHCGAVILPKRRQCVACLAPVAGARRQAGGQLAEIAREIPSTHLPDKTLVFVPEHREARLRRERRTRRALIASLIACLILAVTAFVLWRANERKRLQAASERRQTMAKRELDLYAKALEVFYADFGRYPTAREGLAVLVRRPPMMPGWRGPYAEGDFSVDPWGNDYVYRDFNQGAAYQLFTYGPEGEAAGRPFLQVGSEPRKSDGQ